MAHHWLWDFDSCTQFQAELEYIGQILEHNRVKLVAFPKSIMGKFWSIIGSGLIYSPTLMWKKLSGCGLLCAHVHVVEERVKMEHHVSSVIRGHHVSKSFWTPAIDEIATAITEDSNTLRCGAVSVRLSWQKLSHPKSVLGQFLAASFCPRTIFGCNFLSHGTKCCCQKLS